MKFFNRLNSIGLVFTGIGILIIVQMARIQQNGQSLITEPVWQEAVQPERGSIYDRSGHLLAGNKLVYELGVELNQVVNPEVIARETSRILGLDYNQVLDLASIQFDETKARYIVLEDFIEPAKIDELEKVKTSYEEQGKNDLNGLYWFSYLQRSYPESSTASNVLGFFAFMDRREGKAHFGIEEEYNDLLAGNPVVVTYQLDPGKITEIPDIPPGANIILTIDRDIQAMVEKILDKAVEDNGATSGTVVVMEPETGEILAMATSPRINPNAYSQYSDTLLEDYAFNRAVDLNYEPGSVFKVITMASALDAGVVTPDTEFLDQGYYQIGGYAIYNWDRAAYGPQNMIGCLQHSLNVCLSWVAAEKLGATKFYDYLDAFGIGHRTNIDLAGERVYPLSVPGDSNWYEVNLATNSYGQGLAVTPIQIATAISAVANDGKIMAPHVLKTVITNEQVINIHPRVINSPIKAETAHTLTEMLATSLELEASSALVNGYRVAGKTGTAEIPIEGKGYDTKLTNASFVGWGPTDDPKFLVYIWMEKPTGPPWGSLVAAPIFHDVAQELIVLMNIPPDNIRGQLAIK
jgi:cell division protein FtsI/penicillin-binding protein 2